MNYSEAISYLYDHAPMFHRQGKSAYKTGLDNTLALDDYFGHSHRNFRTIHVAGTNGKGSTSHLLASVLQCAGYKVGLYTSPHLFDFRERIRIDGEMISPDYVANFVEKNSDFFAQIQPSFFEITTALALRYFADNQVDVAVVEVGLGGRLDCTNIITPDLSIITNISLDHTDILGDSLQKIATEKAGIIKPQVPVVIGETQPETEPIFRQKAAAENSDILFADQQPLAEIPDCPLCGIYQIKNKRTALAAIEVLRKIEYKISQESVIQGFAEVLERTRLQGRWQQIGENPRVIIDTGHNEGGLRYVAEQLKTEHFRSLRIVFGMVHDKNVAAALALLPKNAVYYFTEADSPRALPADELQIMAAKFSLVGKPYSSVSQAFNAAKNDSAADDLVFVGGSNYVVAEIPTCQLVNYSTQKS